MYWGLTKGQLRSCDGTTKIYAKQEAHLLVVGKCNTFVHVEENESPDVVQQLQGRRWVKVHSRYQCQWTSDLRTRNMGRSFCGVPSKHTQDWAVNNHMLQTGLSFTEYLCNKTPKKFSKICQNRPSEVKETINFKNLRGAAPNPAGGSQHPPPPSWISGRYPH